MSERRGYAEHPYWKSYQPFFRADMRLEGESLPSEEWWSWRGMDVHVDRLAAPSGKAKLIVLHGGGGYGRLLTPYGLPAWRRGIEVVSPDMPGYGITETRGAAIDYAMWVDCAAELVERERARDARKIVLFGASIGGMLAYSVAARARADAVAVTCLLDPRRREVREAVARVPFLGAHGAGCLGALRFLIDRVRLPVNWLANVAAMANDPALNELVQRDPYGGANPVSLRFLRTYMTHAPAVEPEAFDIPLLLAHPAADRWTPIAVSRPFYDRLACPKRLVMLDRCGHFPVEEPGLTALVDSVLALIEETAK